MDLEKAQKTYDAILKKDLVPLLMTRDDIYNISPKSVINIKFNKEGVSFNAAFDGLEQHVAILYDDIMTICVYGGDL